MKSKQLKHNVDEQLHKYVEFCQTHGIAATAYSAFGTDPAEMSLQLTDEVLQRFPAACSSPASWYSVTRTG